MFKKFVVKKIFIVVIPQLFLMSESIRNEVDDLRRELNDLNRMLNQLVATNINIQSKVTELIVRMDDVLKEVKDMVELLQVATEMERGSFEIKGLNELINYARETNTSVSNVESYVKKIYRRIFLINDFKLKQDESNSLVFKSTPLKESHFKKESLSKVEK